MQETSGGLFAKIFVFRKQTGVYRHFFISYFLFASMNNIQKLNA
jgi:hypothetical protein